ncbi:MAG: hypothetical protein ACRD1V_17950 [Vicinamibacterales bacterium]
MRELRRISRHGNSLHVSMAPRMIDYLRLRPGDLVVVEVTLRGTLEIRRAVPEDMNALTYSGPLPDREGEATA